MKKNFLKGIQPGKSEAIFELSAFIQMSKNQGIHENGLNLAILQDIIKQYANCWNICSKIEAPSPKNKKIRGEKNP